MPSVRERFDAKVEISETGCHLWTASITPAGYGNFTFSTKNPMPAHRAAWLLAGRKLPIKPLVLDHLCRVKHCVNVDHLEIVTISENALRGELYRNDSVCRKGLHPWVPENMVMTNSGLTCRECKLAAQRSWYHANGKPRY